MGSTVGPDFWKYPLIRVTGVTLSMAFRAAEATACSFPDRSARGGLVAKGRAIVRDFRDFPMDPNLILVRFVDSAPVLDVRGVLM